ncbi:hypothetical protein [Azospirillum largimobile]
MAEARSLRTAKVPFSVMDALRLLHREKAAEQEKLEMLRRAVMVGFEDQREGRLNDPRRVRHGGLIGGQHRRATPV